MSSSPGFFNDGAAYERLMGRWSRRVGEIFLDWTSFPENAACCDVGCGTGVFTELLLKHCSPKSVVAIDPSAEQLAFARTRPGLAQVEFRVADAQDLPFAAHSFDIAVMALVIHFVPQPSKAVAEMARVTRPGGRVATYVWDYGIGGSPTARLTAAMKAAGLKAPSPPSAAATSLQVLQDMWSSAMLEQIETRTIRIPVSFDNFDEFWSSMTAPAGPAGQVIAQLPADALARLRAAAQEQTPVTADGRVAYEACANAIKGKVPA